MGLGCCSRLAKYFLFAFNFLFWIVGAILLGVGIWVLVDRNAIELLHVATVSTSDALVKGSAITLVVVGLFVFLIAFFGCFGACRESACMLMTYSVIVGILFGIQLIAGILGAVFRNQILDELDSSMNETVQMKYGQPGFNETTDAYDYMQRSFKCCGALTGPQDYQTSQWKLNNAEPGQTVPLSCCVLTNQKKFDQAPIPVNATLCFQYALSNDTMASDYVNQEGCRPQLEDWVSGHAAILVGVAFGLAIVQIICIVMGCCLWYEVRNSGTYA